MLGLTSADQLALLQKNVASWLNANVSSGWNVVWDAYVQVLKNLLNEEEIFSGKVLCARAIDYWTPITTLSLQGEV